MKKIISLALCLLLVVSLAIPAFAGESTPLKSNAKTVYFNGKGYLATITAHFSATEGARIAVSCQAYITVLIDEWEVEYDTYNYGYITEEGYSNANGFGMYKTTIYTGYKACRYGMSQVIKARRIEGSAEFRGDGNCTVAVEYKNY